MNKKLFLDWQVGHGASLNEKPVETVKAEVPGAVQLDFAKANGLPPHTFAENYKDYGWMEDVFWTYASAFEKPRFDVDERVFFFCGGVDYQFVIRLNGETLREQEGMYTAVEVDITDILQANNRIEIIVFPAPKREGAEADRTQADQCVKPACSYGWDWHPRLIPLGIWDETYIETRKNVHIKDTELKYTLCDNYTRADIHMEVEISRQANVTLKWQLTGKNGVCAAEREEKLYGKTFVINHFLENPALWWPNGHGEPDLYTSRVEIYDETGSLLDAKVSRAGFREVKLVRFDPAYREYETLPTSCECPPITLEVNGRPIFAKGSNWVCPDIFPGTLKDGDYRTLVVLAKEAHMNLLRAWGGATIGKESFFDACDETGVMVWQEFPLACNNYLGTKKYLDVLDTESKSIIKRLRPHPSVAFWCGGNELFNNWSGMSEQSLALRLLDKNCYDMDPGRPYIMTSPVMGVSHGHYLFRNENGEEVFQTMPRKKSTAYTEFGCAAPSPAEYIKTFIPENEWFPPQPVASWEAHHGFNAWNGINTWLDIKTIEDYFGPQTTLEELTENGQILQCEGYKCIFEESRRQKPRCSMALNWCYNEPWPTAAGNSLINWPAVPKPAYYAVGQSCRPVLASILIPKFKWRAREIFNPELWILNDSYDVLPAGEVSLYISIDGAETKTLTWHYPEVAPNLNVKGPSAAYIIPATKNRLVVVTLRVKNRPDMDSEYRVLVG